MKALLLDEILVCSGGELTPCFCHSYKNQWVKRYEGSHKMLKTSMCWYMCCEEDKADAYQWGNDGEKVNCMEKNQEC
jgi:hypothetical protein